MANVKASRKKIETLIYKVYDILDKTGKNTEYYKHLFAGMSDKEFVDFFKQDFPLKYQVVMFKNEPAMDQIIKGLDFIKVPVTEKNYMALQFLDMLKDVDVYSEMSGTDLQKRLYQYMRDAGLEISDLESYFSYYPDKLYKNLIETRVIYNGILA